MAPKQKATNDAGDELQQNMKAQDYVKAEEHTGPRPQKRARKTKTETKQGLRDHVDIPKKTAAVKQQSNVVKKEDGLKTEVTIETGVVTMSRSEKTPQALRPFNFLGLPAEVRNYIYDYVVEDSKNCPPPRIVDNAKKSAWGEELTINSKKKTRTQKETEAYRYRNFGLAQTSRQIRQEFAYLNLSPDSLEVHTGHLIINNFFVSEEGIDIIPLIRLLDRFPDFHVRFLMRPPRKGRQRTPTAYFPGAAELVKSYGLWTDIDFMLDLQAIRLIAPKPSTQIIQIGIPPVRDLVLKLPYKGSKVCIVDDRVSYIIALLCRSIVQLPEIDVRCEVGYDEVIWKMKGPRDRPTINMSV